MKGREQISTNPAGEGQYHIIEEMGIVLEKRDENWKADGDRCNGQSGHDPNEQWYEHSNQPLGDSGG